MGRAYYHYYVTGPGVFPDDMLRYDQAKVLFDFEFPGWKHKFYVIEGSVPPSGRWGSFLWSAIRTPDQCARFGLPILQD